MSAIYSICSLNDCDKPVEKGRDICGMHRARFKKYKTYDKPIIVQQDTCFVGGCDKPRARKPNGKFGSSKCIMHKKRWLVHKSHDLPERVVPTEGIVKICEIHGGLEKDDCYYVDAGTHKNSRFREDYQYIECKSCTRESQINNEDVLYSSKIFKTYGLTLEEFNQMILEQNNACKICGKQETSLARKSEYRELPTKRRLSIDHCHITGVIRGLLCAKCNTGIGMFCESKELLIKAAKYLSQQEENGRP